MQPSTHALYEEEFETNRTLVLFPNLTNDKSIYIVLIADLLQCDPKSGKVTILAALQRLPQHVAQRRYINGESYFKRDFIREYLSKTKLNDDVIFQRIPLSHIYHLSFGTIIHRGRIGIQKYISPDVISDVNRSITLQPDEIHRISTKFKDIQNLSITTSPFPGKFSDKDAPQTLITDIPLIHRLIQLFPHSRCLIHRSNKYDAIIPWYEFFRRCIVPHTDLLKRIYPRPFEMTQVDIFSKPPAMNAHGVCELFPRKSTTLSVRHWAIPSCALFASEFGKQAAKKIFDDFLKDILYFKLLGNENNLTANNSEDQRNAPTWNLGGALPFDYSKSDNPLILKCDAVNLLSREFKPLYLITRIENMMLPSNQSDVMASGPGGSPVHVHNCKPDRSPSLANDFVEMTFWNARRTYY